MVLPFPAGCEIAISPKSDDAIRPSGTSDGRNRLLSHPFLPFASGFTGLIHKRAACPHALSLC